MHGYEGDINSGVGSFGSGAENEVWSYGEDNFQVMKKYLLLRERIRPYIAEQMKKTHETGMPIMRPLFFDFKGDKKAWDVDDQYMFGPDLRHRGRRGQPGGLPARRRFLDRCLDRQGL